MRPEARRRWLSATGSWTAIVLAAPIALAATVEGPLDTVVFEAGDTIRGVAERYLKDPDLWPQILELSGVASPAELRPGTALQVPVQQVAAADEALAFSLAAIQRATAEGARIFAPVEIGSAIENRDIAVERREVGEWGEVVTFAGAAVAFADRALEISLGQRDRAAEAIVSDAQGAVEGRTPDQPRWSSRVAQDVLVEFERVRTLSASTAQVTFRDLSRLRLSPNSNATIQRMRSDPLTGGEVTKVSLVNGDFYALLNQLGDRSTFEVEVPGLETETQSADFWVKHDGEESRFANYDAAALEISRGAETISLGENEGAVVPRTGEAARTEVLARTELDAPFDGAQLYDADVTLSWHPMAGAEAYWLEVAADAGFNAMRASEWGVRGSSHVVGGLQPGEHFWRVSSLDRLGLPGVRSLSRRFRLVDDATPPFVALLAPEEGAIVTAADVALTGESEPGVRLAVNGGYVPVGDDGRFATTVRAVPGGNTVVVAAVDRAGNRTERSRGFVFRPGGAVTVALDPAAPRDAEGRLLTRAAEIDVTGSADAGPDSRLRVLGADGAPVVQTVVAEDGRFHFTVPATGAGVDYRLEVVGPGGAVEGTGGFAARRDAEPPEIVFDAPPPAATAAAWLEIAGGAGEAVEVTVAGSAARLVDGRFDAVASLLPGPNLVEVVAKDAVGNVAVKRFETIFDVDPPEILSAAAGRPQGADGPIEVVVEARDGSGLRQAAPFVLTVGGVERRGFLRCDSGTGACRETLPAEPGALALVEVAVEDYAGNVAKRHE
jgi:hypothetical protein